MVNIPAVLVANGAAILLLAVIFISSQKTHSRSLDSRLFFYMVFSATLQCFLETSAFLFDGKTEPGYYAIILTLNALSYINSIVFSFSWILYADFKLFSNSRRLIKIYPFLAIPAVLIVMGSIANFFVPVFFKITSENVYMRTSLYIIPFVVTYLYLIYGVIMIYTNRNKSNRYLFLPATLFMIPIIIGSLLQLAFYGLSLVWLGVAISLASIYINVQNEVSYIDALSGVYTRQYMNRFLDVKVHNLSQNKQLAGIMLDIDRFKSINDRFGHLVGDEAIRSAGMLLRSCVSGDGFVSRFAGDEFVIIAVVDNEKQVAEIMQKVVQTAEEINLSGTKPYTINFSMGYTVFNRQNDTIDGFVDRMDNAMYINKKTNKEKWQ